MPKISELPTDTAPDVADLVPFVDTSAARTEQVTVDNLAASTAFSGRYAPFGASIFLPAGSWNVVDGSPTPHILGGWLMDATTNEGLTNQTLMPSGWLTFDVFVYWYNAGAGAGDADWGCYRELVAEGDTMTAYFAASGGVGTAGASGVLKITRVVNGAATGDPLLNLIVYRNGTSGLDTLANDVGFMGVSIVRAS